MGLLESGTKKILDYVRLKNKQMEALGLILDRLIARSTKFHWVFNGFGVTQ